MEDLAHFIQSMSEKYGLLDASHKQQQGGNSQHLQDHTSSAASNTFNSEECPASSWECLSIFISGSQSIDCKTVPSGPHALPALANPKNMLPAPPTSLQQQQENTGSPLHSFSKLIDIDDRECPPRYNTIAGISRQGHESPDTDSSHRGTTSAVQSNDVIERGTLVDSCGDLSTAATMSDYRQQSYYPKDGKHSCPSVSKNLEQAQVQHSNKRTGPSSRADSKALLQETQGTKGNERGDSKEAQLHTGRLDQEDSPLEHTAAIGSAGSGPAQQEQQYARHRRPRGVSSTSVGLDSEAEFGEYDIALHEYDISSGRASRDTRTGTDTDGCQEGYQTDLWEEPKENEKKSFGGRNSRSQYHSSSASQSIEVDGERREREIRGSLRGARDYSSTDMSPPDHHHHRQQGKSSSPKMSLEYLPISSAIQSRVAKLDEASKELFAAQSNPLHANESNLTLGLLENDKLGQNSSSSDAPAMKRARSFRDLPYAAERDERGPKLSIKQSIPAPPTKNSLDLESKRPGGGVSFGKPTNVTSESYSLDEAKFGDTSWEQEIAGVGGGARSVEEGTVGKTYETKWSHTNKLLCENGFSPLDWQLVASSAEIADKFLHTLNDVVWNYGRSEKVVQELLEEREALRQDEKLSNEMMQKLESETATVKRKLAASEQRAELANAAAEKTYAALRKDNQRLEVSHANVLQRCSQLEHGSRAKERSLRKLQEKIQEAVEREERQRSKEKELYEKLKHKIAIGQKAQGEVIESNFLLRDLKPATIVGMYERQRAAAEAEMNFLRDENSRLCQELREKENCLLSKMQAISTSEEARTGLDKWECVLVQQLTEAVNQQEDMKNIANLQEQLKSHSAGEQNLSLSLLQKPQMDAVPVEKSQQILQEILRKKLELNSCSSLQACSLNGCTGSKCHEFLQGICSRLKVADPVHITDAIDGLLKVVAAVPRMETFIEKVCDIVFNDGSMFLTRESTSNLLQTPEAVPGIMTSWLEQLQSLEELRQFKESIAVQLWERFDDKALKHSMSSRVAAASVKDLIDIEHQYLLSQASYREGEIILKAEPQKLLHRIISHFQMLFEIPHLEGVMAVMNSVYIQISEYHNFARALCSILGLPKDARPNSIISTITSVLNKG